MWEFLGALKPGLDGVEWVGLLGLAWFGGWGLRAAALGRKALRFQQSWEVTRDLDAEEQICRKTVESYLSMKWPSKSLFLHTCVFLCISN